MEGIATQIRRESEITFTAIVSQFFESVIRGDLPSLDRTVIESSVDGAQSTNREGSKGGIMLLASCFL